MISLKIIFTILAVHWIGDFAFQTDKMAKGKSKNWNDLLSHTGVYSLIWLIPSFIIFFNELETGLIKTLIFLLVTFTFHTITDYFTSRLNSKLWAENKMHWFFVSVGFDQILHYIQLFLTYYLLI